MSASEDVKCECGVPATKLTSQKDRSKGRQFYTCGKDRSCNFFQWVDGEGALPVAGPSQPRTPAAASTSRTTTDAGASGKNCVCGEPAVQREVMKEGQNKGRMFWTCGKPQDQQCGFFEWVDAAGSGGSSVGGGSSSLGGAGSSDRSCFKVQSIHIRACESVLTTLGHVNSAVRMVTG